MIEYFVVEDKKCFKNAEDFAAWAEEHLDFSLEEAKLILGYVNGHGYDLCVDNDNHYLLIDRDNPENEPEELYDVMDLMDRVNQWNYEFLLDDTITGEWYETDRRDSDVIVNILENFGERRGYYIGQPTVKEMIAILSKYPEDYRVTCCGADNYLYLFPQQGDISDQNSHEVDFLFWKTVFTPVSGNYQRSPSERSRREVHETGRGFQNLPILYSG